MKRWYWLMAALLCLLLCVGCGTEERPRTGAEPVVRKEVKQEVPQGVSVLMYHMVATLEDNDAVVHPDHFRAQMKYLHDNGYHPITLAELYAYMKDGAPLPTKPVCITFDDGYEDNYSIVYPIMKEYGFPWTIFVIGDMVGDPGRVTWEQLKEMHENGVTVANHTLSHRQIPYLSEAEQRHEVAGMQALLREKLGVENRFFCYPYGLYSPTLEKILQENGIVLALTMDPGRVHVGDNVWEVQRIWIGNVVDLKHFEERLTTDHYTSL